MNVRFTQYGETVRMKARRKGQAVVTWGTALVILVVLALSVGLAAYAGQQGTDGGAYYDASTGAISTPAVRFGEQLDTLTGRGLVDLRVRL